MPNHVINEVIFTGLTGAQEAQIRNLVLNDKGEVDFELLVPTPLNVWRGSVGSQHQKLGENGLDWSRKNWGTKWNAYGKHEVESTADTLTFRFQTAWGAPYGWLVALLNRFNISFRHNFLSEGGSPAHSDEWIYGKPASPFSAYDLREKELEDGSELHRHLHKLLWGVEAFEDSDEDTADVPQEQQ